MHKQPKTYSKTDALAMKLSGLLGSLNDKLIGAVREAARK